MLAQVTGEGVGGPPSYTLHGLERHTSEQVLEGGADANAMAMFVWRPACVS